MNQVNNVIDVLKVLEDIEYGYLDIDNKENHEIDKNFKKKYMLSSPEEVMENKLGICYDLELIL